jgi:D-alanyl-D-alanine carboxypeptidase
MLRLNQEEECQITLQDALYALLMVSANNIAMSIANNLGSYLLKAAHKQYFSCFDLQHESRDANVGAFMGRMKKLVR